MTSIFPCGSTPIALITGGAKRIGRALALSLAQAGWDIAVHYRHSQTEADAAVSEIRALGRQARAFQADLDDATTIPTLLDQVIHGLGCPQALINNASVFQYDTAHNTSAQSLLTHWQTNVTAPILLTQELHARIPEGQHGVVINLLDQKLHQLNPDFFAYTLSKSALQTATYLMAQSFAPKLRVMGLSPGITLISGDQTENNFEAAHQMTPLGRSSTVDDLAQAVQFILNTSAMTGSTLVVDGGQHLMGFARDVAFLASTA